jgi:hypothetical protein
MNAPVTGLVLVHRIEVADFQATYPGLRTDIPGPRPVRVRAGPKESAVLQSVPRLGASGNEIWVSIGCLSSVKDGTAVTVEKASALQFILYRMVHSTAKLMAFVGFLAAAIGTAVSGVATIHYGAGNVPAVLAEIVLALQILGLAVGFIGVLSLP